MLERDIKDKHVMLGELVREIREVDIRLARIADDNHEDVAFRGKRVSPMDLAKTVVAERGRHDWLEDTLTLDSKFDPQFSDIDIGEIRVLRRQLGNDIAYSVKNLPDPSGLPDLLEVMEAHVELRRIEEIDGTTNSGGLPPMASISNAHDVARELGEWFESFSDFIDAARREEWLFSAYHKFIGVKKTSGDDRIVLKGVLDQWEKLASKGKRFAFKAITLEPPADKVEAFDRALRELSGGERPFGLFGFFKGSLKAALDAVTIEGRKPDGQDDWTEILFYRRWQDEIESFVRKWNAISPVLETRKLADDWRVASDERAPLLQLPQAFAG